MSDEEVAPVVTRKSREWRAAVGGNDTGKTPVEYAEKWTAVIPATVIMLGGCLDDQTSADVSDTKNFGIKSTLTVGGAGGACSSSLLKALSQDSGHDTWLEVLCKVRNILKEGKYPQVPQVQASRPLPLDFRFGFLNQNEVEGVTPTRRALVIGINYSGDVVLDGCQNDAKSIRNLINSMGYDGAEVKMLLDDGDATGDEPTRQNIEDAFRWLVRDAKAGDSFFLHYSGHGTSVADDNGDEDDGFDEALVPVDYTTHGLIRDDDCFDLLVKPLPEGARLTCLIDCCHSGTMLDLPYTFTADANFEKMSEAQRTMTHNKKFDKGGPPESSCWLSCCTSRK